MTDRLTRGEMMKVGESLTSSNGQYIFVYQNDGNLVIYSNITGKPLWDSGTVGTPLGTCGLRDDGSLTIQYFMGSVPITPFSTHTGFTMLDPFGKKAGSLLVVENDGNVAIYNSENTAVWATNTVQPITSTTTVDGPHSSGVYYIPPGIHVSSGIPGIPLQRIESSWKTPDFTPVQPPHPKSNMTIFLPWKQDWVLKGYTRGRLMHTLTLAPQEETTIEIFSWDRRKKTLEQSTSTDMEQSFDDSSTTRDTDDVYKEMTKSNEFQWQVSGELDATYKPGVAEIHLGVKGGVSNKNNLGNIAKTTTNHLHESVSKASTRVKTSRTTKITESTETGSENRVTRKIRNQNLCHTLTLDYFETLAHYSIETKLNSDEIRLCAMILNPLSMITIDDLMIRTHETALRNALLDRALVDGFEACRTLQAWRNAIDILAEQKKTRMTEAQAEASAAKIAADAAASNTPPPPPKPLSKEAKAVLSLLKEIGVIAGQLVAGNIVPAINMIKADMANSISADLITSAKRWLFFQILYRHYPSFVDVLKSIPPTEKDISTELARTLFQALPSKGSNPPLDSFNELSDPEKEVILGPVFDSNDWGAHGHTWAWWYGSCVKAGLYMTSDAGLVKSLSSFENAYVAYLNSESNKDDEGNTPGDKAINAANATQDKANDQDKLEMKFGLDVIANAQEREEALKRHLLDHINYYKYVLFQAQPPSEQIEQIMKISDLAVGTFEPRVVSMRGEYLAIPLITILDKELDDAFQELIKDLKDLPSLKPKLVMIPTNGMTIDSRLGKCSTCEDYIEESRVIELDRLKSVALQTKYEADRFEARLDADPKLLDNPTPPANTLPIRLETAKTPV